MSATPQPASLRTLSPRTEQLAGRITAFMEAHLYPAEPVFARQLQTKPSLHRGEEAHVGSVLEDAFNQVQVREIVLDVEDQLLFSCPPAIPRDCRHVLHLQLPILPIAQG